MRKDNFESDTLFAAYLFPLIGGLGGYSAVYLMVGPAAAQSCMPFAAGGAFVLLACQQAVRPLARTRVIYRVCYGMLLALTMTWYAGALVFPLIWMQKISTSAKLGLFLPMVGMWIWNGARGYRTFVDAWSGKGDEACARHANGDGTVDWTQLTRHLHLQTRGWIPFLGELSAGVVSIALIISLSLGGATRKVFPVFSAWSMAIPCLVFGAFMMQLIGLGIAQLVRLRLLEREAGVPLRPGLSRYRPKRRKKRC